MTRKDHIKILNDKIESNTNQYKVDRLKAEISAFSSGDLNKYEFLTRKDLKYKPNALDKVKFEFSPLGKAFSMGLDKTSQGYQEKGVIKLLKNIRDGLAGGVNRPNNRQDNDDNDDNDNDDNDNDDNDGNTNDVNDDNDNEDNDDNDETGSIDLSWINDLQLHRQIASEVFTRYNRDKDLLELLTLRNFIDNINNERVKNKKDAREEFKTVKKNVKSEDLK